MKRAPAPARKASSHDAQPIGLLAAKFTGAKLSRQTRAKLSRGDSPRSGQPVWRNSYSVGQIENRIWRPINGGSVRNGKRWTGALLKAARGLELKSRRARRGDEKGVRNGQIGEIGLEVLEYLYRTVDYATGQLDPAVRTIADALERSYSAVHDALKRLREAGFIQWIRRSKPKDDPQPGEPHVEQASNAYALLVPQTMRAWLSRLLGTPPIPECENDRRKADKSAFEAMLEGLSVEGHFNAQWSGDSLLGETLRNLARSIDRREAQHCESGRTDETGVELHSTG